MHMGGVLLYTLSLDGHGFDLIAQHFLDAGDHQLAFAIDAQVCTASTRPTVGAHVDEAIGHLVDTHSQVGFWLMIYDLVPFDAN